MAVFALLESSNLISRKICAIENLWIFHSDFQTLQFSFYRMRLGVQGVQAEFWWWNKFVILQWNSVYLCFLVDYHSLYLFRPLYLMYLLLQHCICYLQKRVLIHTPNTVIWKWHYISRKVPKAQYKNFLIFLSHIFHVKPILGFQEVQNLPL